MLTILQMSALHQRVVPAKKPVEPSETQIKGTTARARSSISGCWYAFTCAVTISAFVLLYKPPPIPSLRSYAICSRDGSWIYTLDELNPRTQCLVVRGSYIVDSGTLGKVGST